MNPTKTKSRKERSFANAKGFASNLSKERLVTCSIAAAGSQIRLKFSTTPPAEPGVYVIYQRDPEKPFYVGETGDLQRRLKFLFRCHRGENPHPCHQRHKQVYGQKPCVKDFCMRYGVRWLATPTLVGRLEIEEELQDLLDTNKARFYEDYDPLAALSPQSNVLKFHCSGGKVCAMWPIWNTLRADPRYISLKFVRVHSIGSKYADLLFSSGPSKKLVRVWRSTEYAVYTSDKTARHKIGKLYQGGLKSSSLEIPSRHSGASFLTNSKWTKLPLGQFNASSAAAVVRRGSTWSQTKYENTTETFGQRRIQGSKTRILMDFALFWRICSFVKG